MLLDKGASPECADPSDWPGASTYPAYRPLLVPGPPRAPPAALQGPARAGPSPPSRCCLRPGRTPNCTLTDWSGLQWPALAGDLRRVKLLLDRGGDPSSPCAENALRLAVQLCERPMIELLVTPRRRHRHGRRGRQGPAGHGGQVRLATATRGEGQDDRLAGGADGPRPRVQAGGASPAAAGRTHGCGPRGPDRRPVRRAVGGAGALRAGAGAGRAVSLGRQPGSRPRCRSAGGNCPRPRRSASP